METITSKEILEKDELYELQDSFCGSGIPFKYMPTKEEIEWAEFIRGKYSIGDWFFNSLNAQNELVFESPGELSEAINNDGIPFKAVMLSEETALQKLFFWLSSE